MEETWNCEMFKEKMLPSVTILQWRLVAVGEKKVQSAGLRIFLLQLNTATPSYTRLGRHDSLGRISETSCTCQHAIFFNVPHKRQTNIAERSPMMIANHGAQFFKRATSATSRCRPVMDLKHRSHYSFESFPTTPQCAQNQNHVLLSHSGSSLMIART